MAACPLCHAEPACLQAEEEEGVGKAGRLLEAVREEAGRPGSGRQTEIDSN